MSVKSCRIRDFMTGSLVTFSPDMDVLDAVHQLVMHRIAGAPVVDDHGNLVGMLSELDCLKATLTAGYHGEWGGRVSEFMTRDTKTVDADMSMIDLAQLFLDSGFRRFPVIDGNRLIGQISRHDALRALEKISGG